MIATGGNINDCLVAPKLIVQCRAGNLICDKGYDSKFIRQQAAQNNITVQIPNRKNNYQPNSFDPALYKLRHRIENFFCRIKRHRAIATRYDKLARNFLSFVYLASTMDALK